MTANKLAASGPRFIVHAGFHKTGTTSLQACLTENVSRLAPMWQVETLAVSPALRRIAHAARAFSLGGSPADLALVRAETVAWLAGLALAPGQGALVSSEDLAGHMPGFGAVRDYRALLPVMSALTETVQAFFRGQAQISVLLTTRTAGPWLRSLHWQQAKGDRLTLDFPEFAAALPLAADHGAIARDLRRAIAPAPVHLAALDDTESRRLGPASALFSLAELPADMEGALQAVPRQNAAPQTDLSAAFVALNRQGLPTPALRAAKERLRDGAVPLPVQTG